MGLFSQPLNRSGSSFRPETSIFKKEFRDDDDMLLLAPVKGSESFKSCSDTVRKRHLPQRLWNIMQTPKGSLSGTVSDLQMMSGLESDTDRSTSPVEEQWENENDDVNLLPQQKPSINSPSKGDPVASEGAEFPLQHHTSEVATSRNRSQKNWNRARSSQFGKKCNKSKKSQSEIEIQFECFLEDDDYSYENAHLPSVSQSRLTSNNSSKPTRRTKSVPSWLTQTFEAVKKGCMIPVNQTYRNPSKSRGENVTESNDGCDDESQVQIIFETTDMFECSNGYMFSPSIDVDATACFSQDQLWKNEAPIQFFIPNDAVEPVYSWDYDEDRHLICGDQGAMNGTMPVLVPLV